MEQIKIGTCIPGQRLEQWLPGMLEAGFECFEVNFHMSYGGVNLEELARKTKEIVGDRPVYVASLGYYCNPIQNPDHIENLKHAIDMAPLFGTDMVSTFAGAYNGRPVEEAMPKFKEVFSEMTRYAADKGIRLAIENCPMGGTWQYAQENIAFNPRAWEMMFDAVPAENLGLEWEPGHQILQLIDPVEQLREWAPKVFHMHGKDGTVKKDAVRRYGVLGAVDFAPERTPGFGDTNWRDIFSILHENGYEGDVCGEGYHDPVYHGQWEMTAQKHALQYLKWCRGGDFVPNPWDHKE